MCILGEPTESKLVLGHFGSLWVRISTSGNFIHTAFSEGKRDQNSILRMREVLDAVLEWIPTWEADPENAYRGMPAIVGVSAIQGGFGWRVSRTPHRTDLFLDVRVPPTKPMATARGQVLDMARDLARRFPDHGVEAEVYVTAPGAEIDEGHPLVGLLADGARAGLRRAARAGRDALVLGRVGADARGRADDQLRHLDGPARHDRRREPRHRRPRQDGARLRSRGDGGLRGGRMKLVTYDDGKVGRVDGEEIVRLDVPDMRTYFERGGADDAGERTPLADATLRAPIVPKKFFHTAGNFREHEDESKQVDWSHEIAPWIVFFQNVDAIVGPDEPVVYPEHLTEELDYELELAVILREAGQVVPARGGGRLHRRLRDLQRHHRARHPAPRDALGRLLVLQGDRHLLPARPVDRHARRDPGPARPGDDAARERRAAPGVALRAACP